MNNSSTVYFVTGGTGSIGMPLLRELAKEGHDLRVLLRDGKQATNLPIGCKIVLGDLFSESSIMQGMKGVDVVLHLAALTPAKSSSVKVDEYYRVNTEGTKLLARAAADAGIKRFVYISTIDVYGRSEDNVFDENSNPNPSTPYAASKLRGEEELLSVFRSTSGESKTVILRLATVYGPSMRGLYPKMVKALRSGFFVIVGNGHNFKTLVHEKDAVKAIKLACIHPSAAGKTYNVTDGALHTLQDIIRTICEIFSVKQMILKVPEKYAVCAAQIVESCARLFKIELDLASVARKMTESIAVRGEKIIKELGFIPEFDLEEGWRATIEEWVRKGFVRP